MPLNNKRKKLLETLYNEYNRREFVHPDPLEFLYNYKAPQDIEIVGLIASSLAYGNVLQILKSVTGALDRLGASPYESLTHSRPQTLKKNFDGFKHRMTTGEEMCLMLNGAKRVIKKYGSLNECFLAGQSKSDKTILPALALFVAKLKGSDKYAYSSLLPWPPKGSACKRLNLYLRWMVRKDKVDIGCWRGVPASKLIVPLDTHMHKISLALGLTARLSADIKTAMEITEQFKKVSENDPIKYDFCLTRLGIRDDTDISAFFKKCGV